MALAFAAVVATGQTHGETYVVFVVLYLSATVWPSHPRRRRAPSEHRPAPHRVGAAVLVVAGTLGLARRSAFAACTHG